MDGKEKSDILNTFNWIKVPRYQEEALSNPNVDWKDAYSNLLKHHVQETNFLINKLRAIVVGIDAELNLNDCVILKEDFNGIPAFSVGAIVYKEILSDISNHYEIEFPDFNRVQTIVGSQIKLFGYWDANDKIK